MEHIFNTNESVDESELLKEYQTLAFRACDLITSRLPEQSNMLPGEDTLEEARYAWHLLGSDTATEQYEEEVNIKQRMARIKELVPTIPLQ